MRVGTAYVNQANIDRMKESSASLAKSSYQITSGLVAERFEEIAEDSNQLLNLQDLNGNLGQYVKNIETAYSRLQASENVLQSMNELIQEAANIWTLGRNENSAEVRATIAPKAESLTESFYNLFQSTFDGRYLFSGMASDRTPITVSPTANTFPGDPPPTTYYNGDSQKSIVVTATGISQEYGVTGDEMAFARLKAGLETLWFGLENNSETDIDGAIDLLNQAQEDLSNVLGQVGGDLAGFTLQKERHENTNVFLQERIDEIEKVDISEAMSRFTQEQATLEASMLVITQLNSLSLLDFLR